MYQRIYIIQTTDDCDDCVHANSKEHFIDQKLISQSKKKFIDSIDG